MLHKLAEYTAHVHDAHVQVHQEDIVQISDEGTISAKGQGKANGHPYPTAHAGHDAVGRLLSEIPKTLSPQS